MICTRNGNIIEVLGDLSEFIEIRAGATTSLNLKMLIDPLRNEAAADALNRPAPDVEILGFADRAGDDRTNLALSEARAEAVRDALAGLDIPEDSFLIYARGEALPLVNTGDGVAERRNRRVEITVR